MEVWARRFTSDRRAGAFPCSNLECISHRNVFKNGFKFFSCVFGKLGCSLQSFTIHIYSTFTNYISSPEMYKLFVSYQLEGNQFCAPFPLRLQMQFFTKSWWSSLQLWVSLPTISLFGSTLLPQETLQHSVYKPFLFHKYTQNTYFYHKTSLAFYLIWGVEKDLHSK